jgi:site-specific DNA-cytosine methylase
MGVEPITIDSNLVSAQNRKRLYWTNIPDIKQLRDKGIKLKDILEKNVDRKTYALSDAKIDRVLNTKRGKGFFYTRKHDKIGTLLSGYSKLPTDATYIDDGFKRKLTPTECEKLQTVPLNYTDAVSNTYRYKMVGNGWTIDVIAHIFKSLKQG